MTHHHLDVASVLTLVCSGDSGRRVRQRRSKAWDDTPEGWMMGRRAGVREGGLVSVVWLWRRCVCRSYRYSGQEVWMDARVRSGWLCPYAAVSSRWMPRVVGRRQEARDPCSWLAGPQAGTPGSFRNRGKASARTAGGQTGGSAQVRSYMGTCPPGGDYIMTGRVLHSSTKQTVP